MNQIAWQIHGGSNRKANTFIGGVASVITTSGALATKLGIASNRITNFKIVGSNIECRISGSYVIIGGFSWDTTPCTYYNDIDGLITSVSSLSFWSNLQINGIVEFKNCLTIFSDRAFADTPNITKIILPKVTSIGTNSFSNFYNKSIYNLNLIYIPLCTNLGGSALNNNVFNQLKLPLIIYAHPTLQTNNAGGIDGDLSYAISQGAIVRYVTNFTAPNPITNLSVGNVYGMAVQLNFTAPTGSTNAIDYYEVWLNGVNSNKTITASGQYITGLSLNTAYTIEVKPVDIFYNKSTSNVVSVTTATVLVYQDSLVSYYKMENNVLDSFGANNGTATAITYASGLVGQTAVFNGSTSSIIIPFSDNLSFTDGTNDLPFSISYILNTNSNNYQTILAKSNIFGSVREYEIFYTGTQLLFNISSQGNFSNRLEQTYNISNLNNVIVTHTYNGLGNGGMKMYVNGILVQSSNVMFGTYIKMIKTANNIKIGSYFNYNLELNGKLDEIAIWNTALTAGQVSEINAKLNTGQSLI